jgi:hypothetical protein
MQSGGQDRWEENRRALADAIMSVVKLCEEGIQMRQEGAVACGGTLALSNIEKPPLLTAEARLLAERVLGHGLQRAPVFQ